MMSDERVNNSKYYQSIRKKDTKNTNSYVNCAEEMDLFEELILREITNNKPQENYDIFEVFNNPLLNPQIPTHITPKLEVKPLPTSQFHTSKKHLYNL